MTKSKTTGGLGIGITNIIYGKSKLDGLVKWEECQCLKK